MLIRAICAFTLAAGLSLPAGAAESPPPVTLPVLSPIEAPTPLGEGTAGEILFATRSPYDFDVLLGHYADAVATTGVGRLTLPEGAGASRRVPAMVLLPGSGGIDPTREPEYANLLAANGIAAFVVDYYRPRGVTAETPYGLKVLAATEFDVVTDAYAALHVLAAHPAIDANRIGVMGFSYGGIAARLAMDERIRERLAADLPRFATHVDVYGPCYQQFNMPRTTGAPLLTLRGGADASNDLVACAAEEAALRRAGSDVSSVIYARAGHAWEAHVPRAPNRNPYVAGCTMVYDAAGRASVRGRPMITAADDIDRAARSGMRAASGRYFDGCIGTGYIVGRDEPVKLKADAEILRFLGETL